MLERLFQSKSRQKILTLLILRRFRGSIRSIAKEIRYSPMQTRNELLNLEKTGVITAEEIANAKIYSINEKCNFINELEALVAKASGFDIQINDAIGGVGGIEKAFIYGSYADGTFSGKSDIDLFIIGKPNMKELNSKIFEIQRRIGIEINISIYDRNEFNKRKSHGFIKNVLEGSRIMILGDENELGRTKEKRIHKTNTSG